MSDRDSEKERIEREIIREAEEEARETEIKDSSCSRYIPYLGILLGAVGMFIIVPINVLFGMGAIVLAKKSINGGYKRLGKLGGIIGFLAIIFFVFRVFINFP